MRIQIVLKRLGYTDNQVKVYVAALKMGDAAITDIAERIGMPRTSATEVVNELHRHGLMDYYMKRGRKYWMAGSPEKLMASWNERGAALKNILPALAALRPQNSADRTNILHFFGLEELKNIFDDIIDTRHHIMALMSWDDFHGFFGDDAVKDFTERRNTHFLKVRLITPKTSLSIKMRQRDGQEMRQTKFLPEHIALKGVANFIYGSKTSFIALNRKEPAGFALDNPDVAQFLGIYFESLWHHSTDQ